MQGKPASVRRLKRACAQALRIQSAASNPSDAAALLLPLAAAHGSLHPNRHRDPAHQHHHLHESSRSLLQDPSVFQHGADCGHNDAGVQQLQDDYVQQHLRQSSSLKPLVRPSS